MTDAKAIARGLSPDDAAALIMLSGAPGAATGAGDSKWNLAQSGLARYVIGSHRPQLHWFVTDLGRADAAALREPEA
jgi:hypothetical protein